MLAAKSAAEAAAQRIAYAVARCRRMTLYAILQKYQVRIEWFQDTAAPMRSRIRIICTDEAGEVGTFEPDVTAARGQAVVDMVNEIRCWTEGH